MTSILDETEIHKSSIIKIARYQQELYKINRVQQELYTKDQQIPMRDL